jgi:hypothetical protein
MAVIEKPVSYLLDDAAVTAIQGGIVTIVRRADVYEEDGKTPYYLDAPIIDGSVSVDATRDERRQVDMVFDNVDGSFRSDPKGFWYDKIIVLYRGIETDTTVYLFRLGSFMIDQIESPNFPHTTHVTGRDFTKKMKNVSFHQATTFTNGQSAEDALRGIAVNAGFSITNIPPSTNFLGRSFAYEAGSPRWDAFKEIASAFGYQAYMDVNGIPTVSLMVDPLTAATSWTFSTGEPDGNLASFTKRTADANVFNEVLVISKATNQLPLYGIAQNTEPTSPTSIVNLNQTRTFKYDTTLLTTQAQVDTLALQLLKVQGLESYNVQMEAIVIPWLEGYDAVTFLDPEPGFGESTSFLLVSFTIPLLLGTMACEARRITIVG